MGRWEWPAGANGSHLGPKLPGQLVLYDASLPSARSFARSGSLGSADNCCRVPKWGAGYRKSPLGTEGDPIR